MLSVCAKLCTVSVKKVKSHCDGTFVINFFKFLYCSGEGKGIGVGSGKARISGRGVWF